MNHPNFFRESSFHLSTSFNPTTRRTSRKSSFGEFRPKKFQKRQKSKSKFNRYHNILIDSSAFFSSGFHNSNYLEIIFKIPGSNVLKYLNLKLSNFLEFLITFKPFLMMPFLIRGILRILLR